MNNFEHHSTSQGPDNIPSRKKPVYPISTALRQYLQRYGREVKLPFSYKDLQRFTYSVPLKDKFGQETAWEKVSYDLHEWTFLRQSLIEVYAILKMEGDMRFADHLDVARIDFCFFGNSQPFRIRIVNKLNDNYDHYYIKQADASRAFGLELEHLLSPNRITYFTHRDTLVEEHIPGIPGDQFIRDYLHLPTTNKIRLAKEFVKFNERCFVQLLGDMRSYNYVVNIIPDIEDFQYRIRAIDFDQQSFEGRKNLYLPQFFKDNAPLVETVLQHLDKKSIAQYQTEEKTMMTYRLVSARYRIMELLDTMGKEALSTPEKIAALRSALAEHFDYKGFHKAQHMGQVLKIQLKQNLQALLRHIQSGAGRNND
ncbi:MAG: hypothetical protein EAZ62_04565 [Sphingobacteriia bacterium]|nr:MAG: hypothetical protein EAZ62_04565 [Sphingobacteriia bacterium]